MNRLTALRAEKRYSLEQYVGDVSAWLGSQVSLQQTLTGEKRERVEGDFQGIVQGAYKGNGVVFACQVARLLLFTEARFQFQRMRRGRPGDLFANPDLQILERPWPDGSTGDLLAHMIQDADLAGNAYIRRTEPTADTVALERLRPDWVTIVLGANPDMLNPTVTGFLYEPGGPGSGERVRSLAKEQVAHWAPIPDPLATYRGMSWLTPVIREISADSAATLHKLKFFENGATPNMVVKFPEQVTADKVREYKAALDADHQGVHNAYKTLYLGGGADADVVGSDFRAMNFKDTQGAGETRIAAAAGVPPVIVGLSEGLAAATYSNYGQARRRFADGTIRPLWRSAAAALETVVPPPIGTRLWYDDYGIPFLQEDQKDAADIQQTKASTISSLVREGFTPDSVVAAVEAEDLSLLEHTGKLSVQLKDTDAPEPSGNGQPVTVG